MPTNTPSNRASSAPPTGNRRQQLAAQAAQAERDRTIRRRVGLALLVAVLAAAIFAGVWLGGSAISSHSTAATASSGAQDNGIITVGSATAPVRVEVYQDFMCPYCGRFERANGDDVAHLVADGTVRLELHPLSFLDPSSQGSQYSTRSANAFVTAAKADPQHILAFNSALYANQPAEGTPGLTDQQLAQLAVGAGIDPAVAGSFTAMTYRGWVQDGTTKAFADGINATPTIRINGTTWTGDPYTPGTIKAAIQAAPHE